MDILLYVNKLHKLLDGFNEIPRKWIVGVHLKQINLVESTQIQKVASVK